MRNWIEDFHGTSQKQSPRVAHETHFLDQIQMSLQKPLGERCGVVRKMIDEFAIKDLHLLFPHLLASIFEFSPGKGWALHSPFSRNLEPLRHFLGPKGRLWKLVEKLERDSFLRYEFPVTCLPKPTQILLSEGVIPSLYGNKVQFSGGSQAPIAISMGALEYFLFQFTYFMTQSSSQLDGRFLERSHDTLYTALLTDYLEHFLPTNILLTRSERFPAVYPTSGMKLSTNTSGNPHLHFSPFSGLIKSIESKQSSHGPSFDQSSSQQLIRSEIFLQILTEVWLNHIVNKEGSNTFSSFRQDYFLPSVDHVRVVRMLVKHLHLFMNVNKNLGGLRELNENFYSMSIMPETLKTFKKRLYWFIHHCFAHWPLDATFKFVLETWLSYIQPWRYNDLAQLPARGGRRMLSPLWKPFIRHNLLFYTVILQEFFTRAEKLNLRSSKDTQLFHRVTKVFSQEYLMDMVNEAEGELISCLSSVQQGFVSKSRSPKSPQYSHFMELQISGTMYTPLFMEETINNIRRLVRHIEETLRSLREPPSRDTQTGQNAGWLKRSIKDTINWLQDVFSIDEYYWLIQDENRKAQEHLNQVCRHLKNLFKIQGEEQERTVAWAGERGDASQVSHVSPRMRSVETHPDCVQTEHGIVPTALGKYQMANGLRRFDIQYSGDPDLQPVRTYESVFLVRTLHKLSVTLNEKFAPQLSLIYYSPSWSGILARYLSPALQRPRTLSPVKHDHSEALHSPGQLKISLRYLASYRLWAQLVLLLCFMILFLDRPWLGVLVIMLILIVMFLRNIHAVERRGNRPSVRDELFSE